MVGPSRSAGRLEIYERHFANTLTAKSERRQLALAEMLRVQLDAYLSVTRGADVKAEDVYRHVLQWKGAVYIRQFATRPVQPTEAEATARRAHAGDSATLEYSRWPVRSRTGESDGNIKSRSSSSARNRSRRNSPQKAPPTGSRRGNWKWLRATCRASCPRTLQWSTFSSIGVSGPWRRGGATRGRTHAWRSSSSARRRPFCGSISEPSTQSSKSSTHGSITCGKRPALW